MSRLGRSNGQVLIVVSLGLALIGLFAYLLVREGATSARLLGGDQQADTAHFVAEAGLRHAQWLVENSGCVGDTTLASTSLGTHSYSATIDSPATVTTLTLNPDADLYLRESSPTENNGGADRLLLKNTPGDSFRALYHFDLSSISAGTQLASAVAWFYVVDNDDEGAIELHRVNAAWAEGTDSWSSIATAFDSEVLASLPRQSAAGVWVQINLTSTVQSWVNDPTTNHGLMLMPSSVDLESRLASREYSSGLRPYLKVVTAVGPLSPLSVTAIGVLDSGPIRTLDDTGLSTRQSLTEMVLQPGAGLADAYTWDGAHDATNFGASNILSVNNASAERTGLLRFEFGVLPPSARIVNAQLGLYLEGGNGLSSGVLDVHRVTQAWIEGIYDDQVPPPGGGVSHESYDGQTFWATGGGDYASPALDSITIPGLTPGWYEWDVTDQVKDWHAGDPNYGLLLRASGGTVDKVDFTSSDSALSAQHPTLTLTLSCECGAHCSVPKSSGDLLLVVANSGNPSAYEQNLKAILEGWGYNIELISDSASQSNFNTAVSNNDVAYVSESISGPNLGSKLKNAPIGVVNEEGLVYNDFGVSFWATWPYDDELDVVDTTHPITQVFGAGVMPFKTGVTEVVVTSGSLAPGAVTLARIGGPAAVVAIDQGGGLYGGGTAAGRRVMLPLGGDANSNWKYLNGSGRLLVQRSIEWAINRAPTALGYYEAHQPWSATQNDTWQTFDLSSLGVTPGAVAEVAIANLKSNEQLWAGIRTKGSGLDRRFHIHEAESGGADLVVMHVQTDGNGEIEHYADTASEIEFTLLGYWVGPTYVERFDTFSIAEDNQWLVHDLLPYGVGDGTVSEIVMTNTKQDESLEAGVRPLGSSLDRDSDLQEAEGAGVDAATMFVAAAGVNASAEFWAQSKGSIEFHLVGYWSVAPGTYTASADWEILPTSPNGAWTPWDLSGFGIPPGAVVQVALNNQEDDFEAELGVRPTGSSLERRLVLHEAEDGGDDVAVFHVNVDAASMIEWYDSNASRVHEFEILGWWVLPTP